MLFFPCLLAGGTGTRLWPLSRPTNPKQFLRLKTSTEQSLLEESLKRFCQAAVPDQAVSTDQSEAETEPYPFCDPIIICSERHRFLVAEQCLQHAPNAQVILEPSAKNTFPAAIIAALAAKKQALELETGTKEQGNPLVILAPADHSIDDNAAFQEACQEACKLAQQGGIVTFGIKPTSASTQLGYIERTEKGQEIQQFHEKPDQETAEAYLKSGKHYWNSGIFVFAAKTLLAEAERLEPETLALCQKAFETSKQDLDFLRLGDCFNDIVSDSIDYQLMENTKLGRVVEAQFDWSDIGNWETLWEVGPKDESDNLVVGDAVLEQTSGSLVISTGPMVATHKLKDHVVVATKDAVLVSDRLAVADLKPLIANLQAKKRPEVEGHPVEYRPWGHYETLILADRFQVKEIVVKPGAKLSDQYHFHRSEHWVVVEGTARVLLGEETKILSENQSIFVPLGVQHSISNPGKIPLKIIEVQSGPYLGEDDIVRTADVYGRG